jgi:glucosylglycerate phosphorylase
MPSSSRKDKKPSPQEIYHDIATAYNPEPDYTKPLHKIPLRKRNRMFDRMVFLYGKKKANEWMPELRRILKVHHAHKPDKLIKKEKDYDPKELFTEKDIILITYGDIIKSRKGITPLQTLHQTIKKYNRGAINSIHILPFFPYSSDRGFAVVDYNQVDPNLGTWQDILEMDKDYKLMFDAVVNHCSSRSDMFKEFLNGDPQFKDFFIAYKSPSDLTPDQRSKIFRPRTSDILTRFDTFDGPRYVWTTFSADQVDLNFRNPAVLMAVLEGLLMYVRHGANLLRMDAVTYIWAEPGTESVHLPQTHEIVKLMRDVMDAVAPEVAIITETNVPHKQNISYFGNGYDEAHMVYNFALPPLVLHTFYREDATALSKWAEELKNPSKNATFFNMLDTHDGIGLMGVKGILSQEDIDFIIKNAKKRGAFINYKMTKDRTHEPYEINSTWWSALNNDKTGEDIDLQIKRALASRSISLVIQGVPAVYIHGIFGTQNDHKLVKKTKVNRDINRGAIDPRDIEKQLENPKSKFSRIRRLASPIYEIRSKERAFHPHGKQKVLMLSPSVFAVFRTSPEGNQHILAMTNVTGRICKIEIPLSRLNTKEKRWFDLVGKKEWKAEDNKLSLTLKPYQIIWLKPVKEIKK